MIALFDVVLFLLVATAFTLSKVPKKTAIGACMVLLALCWLYNIVLPGSLLYWYLALTDVAVGALLTFEACRLHKFTDRMYYLAMASFLTASAAINTAYLCDIGAYSSYPLYVDTSEKIGLIHALFMLGFSDGLIDSRISTKMFRWLFGDYARSHHRTAGI